MSPAPAHIAREPGSPHVGRQVRRGAADRRDDGTTYPEVGGTRRDPMPTGYRHVERSEVVGHGPEAFRRAADGLLGWGMHRGAGLTVDASAPVAAPGVVVVLRLPPLPVVIPCRVVHVLTETRSAGFAYGTLPGHPERGEESFELELAGAGEVRLRIRAFSRPATLLARAGGPVTRLVQDRVTDRYVAAIRALAGGPAR